MPSSRTFDADSHAQFAALSGDYNPIHVDPVAARRTLAGEPVVHGVHTLLWLLDCVAALHTNLPAVTSLKARFRKLVYVGEHASAEVLQRSGSMLRARVIVDGGEVVSATLGFDAAPPQPPFGSMSVPPSPPPTAAVDLPFNEIEGLAGRLAFVPRSRALESMFPLAAGYFGGRRVAALACSSCLVGMVVPGLHSLYGGLDLRLDDDRDPHDALEYRATLADPRFRLVRLAIRGGGLVGSLDAMSRVPPVSQPSMVSVASLVGGSEFLGTKALVVGGSRGLGELTSKLIAAGGGSVTVTYSRGEADALAVAAEIRAAGGRCAIARYDAHQPAEPQLAALDERPTHVYYFATPTISRRRARAFDPRAFDDFNAIYLRGFADLVESCVKLQPHAVRIFYPSTVYVDRRPLELTEYVMSKAAGEVLCADLQAQLRGVQIIARRLPRLPTDQTNSLVPMEMGDALTVMLGAVREMHADRVEPTPAAALARRQPG